MRFRSDWFVSLLLVMVLLAGCTLFGKRKELQKLQSSCLTEPQLSADVRLVEGSKEITKGNY